MSDTSHKQKKVTAPETLTLQQAQEQLQQLVIQNRELQRQLAESREQNQKCSPRQISLFDRVDQQTQADLDLPLDKGLLRSIVDAVDDLIYVKDLAGVYRACNNESERFVGLSEGEQIGKTDFDIFPPEQAEIIQATDQQILTSGLEYCAEEWVPDPDGKILLLETKKAPFYGPDGQAAGIVGISRNITERKQVEDALKIAIEELDAFAHTVAHDLRTPLTPLIGYAELLRGKYQDQLDAMALSYLDEIISSGQEMLQMIKDLLALAVVGKAEIPKVAVNTGRVAGNLISSLRVQLASAGVSVKLDKLPMLRIPKTLLFQIFENLILNALKYGSNPGDEIEVGATRNGERVTLYVRDHGPGIPADERERIFKVFTRGTTAGGKPGTGIGLATVQKIAGLFDGRAWVEETPGGGSTFRVEFSDIPAS